MKKSITKKISIFIALLFTLLLTTLPVAFAVSVNPDSIAVDVTDSSAAISWNTDTAATGAVNYGTSTSSLNQAPSTEGETTSHATTITNLQPNEYYYYNIEATDSAGTYTTTYMNFTTLLEAPQNFAVDEQELNSVILEWDDVDGAQLYYIFKDNSYLGVASTESYEVADLSYSKTYSFYVTAVDKYGRQGDPSDVLQVTTEAEPVGITFVQATSITKTISTITWLTDRETNSTVKYGTSSTNLNNTFTDADKTLEHTAILKNLEEDKTYYYQVGSASTFDEDIESFKTLGDETQIKFSGVNVDDITRASAEVSWTTNVETRGYVYYSTDDSFSQSEREDSEQIIHNQQLENLLSGTTYYFKLVADDYESTIYNFTTSESLYDFIDMEDVPDLWNSNTLLMKGTTAENAKVYIFVNKDSNPYAQVMMDIEGTYFEANVTLNPYAVVDGVKGRNIVEIHSWDEDNNKALKLFTVDVDTSPPTLTVNELQTYFNKKEINVSGYTDKDTTVTFYVDDKKKEAQYISDEDGYFEQLVGIGTSTTNHTLKVEAMDLAGNTAEYEKIIYVDMQNPKITFYTSFTDQTHYKLFRIDGNTEPGAYISATNYGEYSGCEDQNFQTKYGECDYLANVYGPGPYQSLEVLLDPTSLMIDLLAMHVGIPTTTVADDDGNFSIIVSLMPGEVDQQLLGKNTIIFNVTDQAGNKYDTKKQIKYQPSCIDWTIGETTSFPINIYSQDLAAGDLLGSSLFELRYIGGGTPDVAKITVQEDDSAGKLIKEGTAELGTSESLYYSQSYGGLENSNEYIKLSSQDVKYTEFDPDKRKVYVYAPITISRYKDNVNDLPEQLGVYLDTYISYTDGSGQVAACHLYPAVSYDIQKPESLTKWLSPTMINETIQFLDNTINVTESAVKYLGIASRWTLVGCGAVIAWNYAKGFGGANFETVDGQQCNTDLKNIYAVCDRILCPSIPEPCDGFTAMKGYTVNGKPYNPEDDSNGDGIADGGKYAYETQKVANDALESDAGLAAGYATHKKQYSDDSFADYVTKQKSKGAGNYDLKLNGYDEKLSIPGEYQTEYEGETVTVKYYDRDDILGDRKTKAWDHYDAVDCPDPDNVETIIIYTGLDETESAGFSIGGAKAIEGKRIECSEKTKEELGDPSEKDIPGCWSEECPNYDNVKCLVGPGYGLNPAEGLFTSLQCGCLTGAKGHLENLLKILYAAKKCFQQALIGETTAGYCERLLSYFVCDILTQIFKSIFHSLEHGTGFAASLFGPTSLENYQESSESISTGLKDRYGNIVTNKLGLSTDDIVNKACLAAFTADWSLLEDALDTIVDEIPVAPIASAQGYSRPYGFDPFTGKLSIAYNIYVGIVPGGETYIEAWLECDPNYNGGWDYCAQTGSDKIDLVAKTELNSYMTKDDFFDENLMYIDENSASWYNKLELQLKYRVGDEWKTQTITKPISTRGDISMLDCSFHIATGFDCDIGAEWQDLQGGVGGSVQLYSASQGTTISPDIDDYYGANQVAALVKLTNSYPQNFYIRVNNGDEYEYWAVGGTDSGDYRGLQYYLLWIDKAGSSTSSGSLANWEKKITPTGTAELGFELPTEFTQATLKLYPFDIADNSMTQIQCKISKTGTTYDDRYGVRIDGDFYPIKDDTDWKSVCAKDSSFNGCGTTWDATLELQYSRVDGNAYKCLTKYDKIKDVGKDYDDIAYVKYIRFGSETLATGASKSSTYKFNLHDGVTEDGDNYIETKYSSSSSSSKSKSATINVLSDTNDNAQGETKIYSSDQKPADQEVKLSYTFKEPSTSTKIRPIIQFIEPVTIIEEDTGYVNSDYKDVPIGFTLWDDKNEIDTISVGIISDAGWQCKATWEYDESKDGAGALKHVSSSGTTGYPTCGLTISDRTLGFSDDKPPFFEFYLTPDEDKIMVSDDAYYDISIHAEDANGNTAEPKAKRIRFGTNIGYTQNGMLVCLGSGECASDYTGPETDVESIAKSS